MDESVKICYLCGLLLTDNNYEMLNGFHMEMLNLIHNGIDSSTIVKGSLICYKCLENLNQCHNFKTSCYNTENYLKSVINSKEPLEKDTKIMLSLGHQVNGGNVQTDNLKICRLCLKFESSSQKLNDPGDKSVLTMMEKCLSEINMNLTPDPIICHLCLERLNTIYIFVSLHINTDTDPSHLDEYLNKTKQPRNHEILNVPNSNDVIIKYEPYSRMDIDLKIEKKGEENVQNQSETDNTENNSEILVNPNENVIASTDLEDENLENNSITENVAVQKDLENTISTQATNIKKGTCRQRTLTCKKCGYNITDPIEFKKHYLVSKCRRIYKCESCDFFTPHKNVIDNHKIRHVRLEEVVWYHCEFCTYKTKWVINLDKHKMIHTTGDELKKFKCEDCPYKSMWKRDLERHMVIHKSHLETTMYSCDICSFRTKHERYLKLHLQKVHIGEKVGDTIFNCANCEYTCRLKRNLISHMLVHKKPEDVILYSCDTCSFTGKSKTSVKRHKKIHLQKYKCAMCDFQTTLKRFLIEHIAQHKPLDSLPEYSCPECEFKSRFKHSIETHRLVHRKPHEVEMHACPHCPYQSKRKADFRHHVKLLHTEDIAFYNCESCSYITKYKNNLKNHRMMLHDSSGKLPVYKCEHCSFKTKYRMSYKYHVEAHGDSDKRILYKCEECEYTTNRKECLNKHKIKHRSLNEVTAFQCGLCSYITKYKRGLIKHMETHKNLDGSFRKIINCEKCDYKTVFRACLKKHLRKFHTSFEEVKVESQVNIKEDIVDIEEVKIESSILSEYTETTSTTGS